MTYHGEPIEDSELNYSKASVQYDTKICPICGNRCKHPETGHVNATPEKWQRYLDDDKYCIISESVDASGSTIGYHIALCRGQNNFKEDDNVK